MMRIMKCCLALAVLGLCLFGGMAQAQDTSPFLAGFWSEDSNNFIILNPTTKPLTVYAIFCSGTSSKKECNKRLLPPNGRWSVDPGNDEVGQYGTAKFFAFPQGTKKFDPNAVIGGFQQKKYEAPGSHYRSESNLKAVTINTYTLREFSMIPPEDTDPCYPFN
jgi:hypothetical protein